jgi:hypothetical protein
VSKPKKTPQLAPAYTPTAVERSANERVMERQARKAPTPRFKIKSFVDKVLEISPVHPDSAMSRILLADAFGTGDHEFASGVLAELTSLSRSAKSPTDQEMNFMLSLVRGINPNDETEALLAAQMAAIHTATMVAARRLANVDTIPQQDSASNMLNKLARTFAAQVEALKKYRSAGEQTIKVQHVTVNDGGQAIVGDVRQGGGGTAKNGGQPHEPSATDELGPALLSHEQTLSTEMPSPGSSRLVGVSLSRSEGRSAKRRG